MSLPLSLVAIDDLDPTGVLARAEAALVARRAAQVEDLELALAWADLHAEDPRNDPDAPRRWRGGDRLVQLGGHGTPLVRELCLPELAIARHSHTLATRAALADALDLRHRLPATWALVRDGQVEVWLARKVAALSRRLEADQIGLVDTAVAAAAATQAPARVLSLTEAKIIEADTAAHHRRLEAQRRHRMVTISHTDAHGARTLHARIDPGHGTWIDTTLDQVAHALATRPDLTPGLPPEPSHDELRSIALGWLAHPEAVLDLLEGRTPTTPAPATHATNTDASTEDTGTNASTDAQPRPTRSEASLVVHLHQACLDGTTHGTARAEHDPGLGPLLLGQLTDLLAHTRITVLPVLDLHTEGATSSYEFPEAIKTRVHLRNPGETFPHSPATTRRIDHDHVVPYDPTGPPGQTSDHNVAKLDRTHHRAKTHLGYRLRQTSLDRHLWTTPHGLHRTTGPEGTRILDDHQAHETAHPGQLDAILDRLCAQYLTG